MSRLEWFGEEPSVRDHVVSMEEQTERERVPRVMALFDQHGATFEAVPGWPGWYAARWTDEAEYGDCPHRWACCIDIEEDCEWPYARAFKARAEAGARS
jgi:hypothetical protein